MTVPPHGNHCFVVMPSGRQGSDQRWFKGWYEVVIKAAVAEAGYEPVLAATEEQPGAINDEIRTHLAEDRMVVVDLGGVEPTDEPNPNVMYELGIRHALDLPVVLMGWKGQRLPFDVGNQRVIMEDRDLLDIEPTRRKVIAFIRAAEEGKYYRPMQAVRRVATIQAASESLGEDSLLRALAAEVRGVKQSLEAMARREGTPPPTPRPRPLTMGRLLQRKGWRKIIYPEFLEAGGAPADWPRFCAIRFGTPAVQELASWNLDDFKKFARGYARDSVTERGETADDRTSEPPTVPRERSAERITQELLEQVRSALPPQPWAQGVHKTVAEQLGVTPSLASKCIRELISRGVFRPQAAGKIVEAEFGQGEQGV